MAAGRRFLRRRLLVYSRRLTQLPKAWLRRDTSSPYKHTNTAANDFVLPPAPIMIDCGRRGWNALGRLTWSFCLRVLCRHRVPRDTDTLRPYLRTRSGPSAARSARSPSPR
eukprot:3880083-Prymnesium_polylepis.1